MAAKTPVCLEYIRDPILNKKKLVRVPNIIWGILKEYASLSFKKVE